jgi:hypothetical protein
MVVELTPNTPVHFPCAAHPLTRVARVNGTKIHHLVIDTANSSSECQRDIGNRRTRQAGDRLSVCVYISPQAGHAFVSCPVATSPAPKRCQSFG